MITAEDNTENDDPSKKDDDISEKDDDALEALLREDAPGFNRRVAGRQLSYELTEPAQLEKSPRQL